MFSKMEMDLIRQFGFDDTMSRRKRRAFLQEHDKFTKLLDSRRNVVEDIVFARNLTTLSGDDWSPAIWHDCPTEQLKRNPGDGLIFEDNFLNFPITPPTTEGNWGNYAVFSDTGGSITSGTGAGRAEVVIGSDDDNEAVGIRQLAAPFQISRSTGSFWFEAQLKVSTIADTKAGVFCGLCENTAMTATNIMADAGTLADHNFVGFHRLEGDGDKLDTVYKANGVTQVTVQADAVTLVADTYVNVGLRFAPYERGNYNLMTFFANNQPLSTTYTLASAAGTDFPNDVKLGLMLMIKNAAGTSPCTATIRRWRAAQKF